MHAVQLRTRSAVASGSRLRLTDDGRNGLIGMTDPINGLATHVPRIASNGWTAGMAASFESDVFMAGL